VEGFEAFIRRQHRSIVRYALEGHRQEARILGLSAGLFGEEGVELYRRLAAHVGADIPAEQATKCELVLKQPRRSASLSRQRC
jgi:hypothetical protein